MKKILGIQEVTSHNIRLQLESHDIVVINRAALYIKKDLKIANLEASNVIFK